jgi:hypothetical protein
MPLVRKVVYDQESINTLNHNTNNVSYSSGLRNNNGYELHHQRSIEVLNNADI